MTYGINAPLGLVVSSYYGAAPFTGLIYPYTITTAYAISLFQGDLVTLTSGLVARFAAGGGAATPPVGVFQGCTYTDTNGVVQFSKYWPASTAVFAGTTAIANVITDPNIIFTIQANATVTPTTANAINKNADISFATAGSTSTGQSAMTLDTNTLAATAILPLHIIGFDSVPGNVSGLPYANLFVKLNNLSTNAGATGV
jgi:hypothetical protein